VNALPLLGGTLSYGSPIGGFIFAFLGLNGVVVLDVASFIIAGAMIALIRANTRPMRAVAATAQAPGNAWGAVWREWLDGLRLVPGDRLLAMLFLFITITGVGEGIMSTLFVPFVTRVLGGNGLDYGWILSAQAVGGLAGSLIVGRTGLRVTPSRMLGGTAVLFGFADLAVFFYPYFIPGTLLAIVFMIVAGILVSGMVVSLLTMEQTAVSDAYRGRILGAFGTTGALLRLVGSVIAGVLGDRLGIVPVISVQGFGYIVAGVMMLLIVRRIGAANAPAGKQTAPSTGNADISGG